VPASPPPVDPLALLAGDAGPAGQPTPARPSSDAHDGAAAAAIASGAATVASWLASLGVGGPPPAVVEAELGPASRAAPSFADGVLLCDVVARCEDVSGLRRPVGAVDRTPRTGAARLANTRRALELLRGHRGMPLTHLWSELALRNGEPGVVRELLLQVRRAYGHHLGGGGHAAGGGQPAGGVREVS
jgi:hypothetical protein